MTFKPIQVNLDLLSGDLMFNTTTTLEEKDNISCGSLCMAKNNSTARNCNLFYWTSGNNCVNGFLTLQFALENLNTTVTTGEQTLFFDSVMWK